MPNLPSFFRAAFAYAAFFYCQSSYAADALRVDIGHTEPWGYYATTERADSTQRSLPVGIIADIAEALSKESGISFEKNLTPLPRIWRNLKIGDADLSFLIRSEDRDGDVIYVGYLFSLDTLILARPGMAIRNYDDLYPLRIGVLRDIRLNHHFDHDSALKKLEFRDYEAMVDTLIAGRIDAVAGNQLSLEYLLYKRGFNQASQWPRLILQKSQVWAQMSRHSPHQTQAEKLRSAIDQLRSQGFFDHLLGHYGSVPARNNEQRN